MFTDIYVSIQAAHVLQERWQEEALQSRPGWLATLLRRRHTSK